MHSLFDLETVGGSFWPHMTPKKAKIWKKPQNPKSSTEDSTLKCVQIKGGTGYEIILFWQQREALK